jgi:DNA segregation ATPase FtsK/SpoIIIE-like protein
MKLYITSTKIKDFYPFKGLKDVYFGRTDEDFLHQLNDIKEEYKKRDDLLYSKELEKAIDAKSVKKLYPDKYFLFKPIFVIIDEYARFSENKQIQKIVTELVETAGYVNVHLIVSTQRPDAKNVLPARLKANLLARICFTTTDKNNSMIILDQFGAEKLGRIQGRAIYLDGDLNVVQIPYIDPIECEELLKPFRSEQNETDVNQETEGSINSKLSEKIQSMFEKSISVSGVSEQQQSDKCNQSSNETISNGWFSLADKENKR